MLPIQRTLKKYSAGSNIFWELGYQDTSLFPGLPMMVKKDTNHKVSCDQLGGGGDSQNDHFRSKGGEGGYSK